MVYSRSGLTVKPLILGKNEFLYKKHLDKEQISFMIAFDSLRSYGLTPFFIIANAQIWNERSHR